MYKRQTVITMMITMITVMITMITVMITMINPVGGGNFYKVPGTWRSWFFLKQ